MKMITDDEDYLLNTIISLVFPDIRQEKFLYLLLFSIINNAKKCFEIIFSFANTATNKIWIIQSIIGYMEPILILRFYSLTQTVDKSFGLTMNSAIFQKLQSIEYKPLVAAALLKNWHICRVFIEWDRMLKFYVIFYLLMY
jgi:hypothetical protein